MNLLRKSDFGPLNFSSKFMTPCTNPILIHFAIVRIFDFGPISIRSKNLDQNRKFELLKSEPKSDLNTWSWISKKYWVNQDRVFEVSPSRENELLQTLFLAKKTPLRTFCVSGHFGLYYCHYSIVLEWSEYLKFVATTVYPLHIHIGIQHAHPKRHNDRNHIQDTKPVEKCCSLRRRTSLSKT